MEFVLYFCMSVTLICFMGLVVSLYLKIRKKIIMENHEYLMGALSIFALGLTSIFICVLIIVYFKLKVFGLGLLQ